MNERYPTQQRTPTKGELPALQTKNDKARPAMAVALHYNGRGAPRVTAKGGGLVAQRIIETARQHGVPLEEDAALVDALSRVDLGREIPRELWIAVAHVLTFAWSVAGKKKP